MWHVWGSVLCVVHHAGYQPEQIHLQAFFLQRISSVPLELYAIAPSPKCGKQLLLAPESG